MLTVDMAARVGRMERQLGERPPHEEMPMSDDDEPAATPAHPMSKPETAKRMAEREHGYTVGAVGGAVAPEPASDAAKGADEAPLTHAFIAELRRRLRKYPPNEHFVRVGPRDSALLVGELDALCEMAAAHEETKRAADSAQAEAARLRVALRRLLQGRVIESVAYEVPHLEVRRDELEAARAALKGPTT